MPQSENSKTLHTWHAKRAGGRITVYGTDVATGKETKITNVERIDPPTNHALHEVTALDKNNVTHRLVFTA